MHPFVNVISSMASVTLSCSEQTTHIVCACLCHHVTSGSCCSTLILVNNLLQYPQGGKLPCYCSAHEQTTLQAWELMLCPRRKPVTFKFKCLVASKAILLTYWHISRVHTYPTTASNASFTPPLDGPPSSGFWQSRLHLCPRSHWCALSTWVYLNIWISCYGLKEPQPYTHQGWQNKQHPSSSPQTSVNLSFHVAQVTRILPTYPTKPPAQLYSILWLLRASGPYQAHWFSHKVLLQQPIYTLSMHKLSVSHPHYSSMPLTLHVHRQMPTSRDIHICSLVWVHSGTRVVYLDLTCNHTLGWLYF